MSQAKLLRIHRMLATHPPSVVAKEVAWRLRRRWLQRALPASLAQPAPVKFRPAGYYSLENLDLADPLHTPLVEFADLVCAGNFSHFGFGPVELGMPPDWHRDFLAGKTWEVAPSAGLTLRRGDGSDVKVPWELSRLNFLPVLAKAAILTGQQRYRGAVWSVLQYWEERNPVGLGVNWAIAMEAALRAMSICFALELMWPIREEERERATRAEALLWRHLLFIDAHSEYSHFITSNHFLTNAVGAYCIARYLDGPGTAALRRQYRAAVEREIQVQVYPDGGDYEASTGYHVFVMQLLTVAYRLMLRDEAEPTPEFRSRLEKMYRFATALALPDGRLPQIGDYDDGRVEWHAADVQQMLAPAGKERDSLRIAAVLESGAHLFDAPSPFQTGAAQWFGGGGGEPARAAAAGYKIFPDSGIAVARQGDAQLFFLAMPNGIRSLGSHTHNDKLSLLLSISGHELLADRGTFCYTRDAAARNDFRSTRSHNTVTVDDCEQNELDRSAGMLFRHGAEAEVTAVEAANEAAVITFAAEHRGYHRIGVHHRRTVTFRAGSLQIRDEITGSGEHEVAQHFHIPDEWEMEMAGADGQHAACRLAGGGEVRFTSKGSVPVRIANTPVAISRAYGASSGGHRLRVATGRVRLPVMLESEFSW